MFLNKWDYRYPFFGIQKLHNYKYGYGYGYGLPMYPKVNTKSNFLSIVNRLEEEIKELQGIITEETLDDLRHLLEQFNGVDSVLNVDDVQAIVDYAIGTLEFPDVLTIDEVKQEITDAINTIDVGLTVMEVQMLVGEMLDELELGLSQTQVETLIHESIAMIDTGLKQPQVEFLINKALMDIDKGLTEEEIIQLIEFHSQTIPLDFIINDIDNLRREIELIEIPEVDLTPIMLRIEELKNSMGDEYDDTHIIDMINEIREDVENIDSGDVDLTEIYNYLNSLEADISRVEYDDSWIRIELDDIRTTIDSIEVEGVDLTLVYDRLHNLEVAVDNDTIYDDTELRFEVVKLKNTINDLEIPEEYDDTEVRQDIDSIRYDLENIEIPDVDLSVIDDKLLSIENSINNIYFPDFKEGNPEEWYYPLQEVMDRIHAFINTSSTDPLPALNEERINTLIVSLEDISLIVDDLLAGSGGDVDLSEITTRIDDLTTTVERLENEQVKLYDTIRTGLNLQYGDEYQQPITFPDIEWDEDTQEHNDITFNIYPYRITNEKFSFRFRHENYDLEDVLSRATYNEYFESITLSSFVIDGEERLSPYDLEYGGYTIYPTEMEYEWAAIGFTIDNIFNLSSIVRRYEGEPLNISFELEFKIRGLESSGLSYPPVVLHYSETLVPVSGEVSVNEMSYELETALSDVLFDIDMLDDDVYRLNTSYNSLYDNISAIETTLFNFENRLLDIEDRLNNP